jgi:hypothetical protein
MTALWLAALGQTGRAQPNLTENDIVLESLPEDVVASMDTRDRWFASLPPSEDGVAFVVEDLLRWTPGQTVRVAFLGGDQQLHADIADAAKKIMDACHIVLDFGIDPETGAHRTWSTEDSTHTAEIRVSFDQGGYFSLVGRDSINNNIGSQFGPVGGRPHQRSLNLGGFDIQKPAKWRHTVRHEFLHALAFHHEHQSPTGGCDDQFRWQDDPGYRLTQDVIGRFINDSSGNRPGIYTYLSGFPNFWGRAKVDHNLRQLSPSDPVSSGEFDQRSIMLYRFPPLFYRNSPSPCAPLGDGEDLSQGDIDGLVHLYPREEEAAVAAASRQEAVLKTIMEAKSLDEDVKAPFQMQLDLYHQQK